MERYEKCGSAWRAEFVRGAWFTMRVIERGSATSSSNFFKTESLPQALESLEESSEQLESIRRVISSHAVERASFTIGSAAHSIDDHAGTRQWKSQEEIALVTLSGSLGNAVTTTLLPARAAAWIAAAASVVGHGKPTPEFLREPTLLEPVASAQLWAFLVSSGSRLPRPVLEQRARSAADRDGAGVPIDESSESIMRSPNLFRPSYRFPPSKEAMHVRASATGVRVDSIGRILSLDDFHAEADRLTARAVLSTYNEGGVTRVTLHQDAIRWISDTQEWFPIRGGVWGGESVIDVSAEPGESRRT